MNRISPIIIRTALVWLVALAIPLASMAACFPQTADAAAVTIQPQAAATASTPDLLVTSIVGSKLLDDVELYNQSAVPIQLDGWRLEFSVRDTGATGCTAGKTASIVFPAGWMLSKKYLAFERTAGNASSPASVPFSIDETALLSSCTAPQLSAIRLIHAQNAPLQTITIPANTLTTTNAAQHKQRGNSPSSARTVTGDFATDYKLITGTIGLNSDPLYAPPIDASGLQLLEILPNARDCSPLETDLTCDDYVKLYNPTTQPINMARYRLRIGYADQSSSVTNTFTWGQTLNPAADEVILQPGAYFTLTMRNDGDPLSITDTGNYVWLEDAYGIKIYDPVIQYPDASSTTKVGQAWAFDGTTWRWSAAPQPTGANSFPTIDGPTDTTSATDSLQPCAANQYRNPDTNRCNTITVSASTLVPCKPGQTRNEATNRCRSVLASSSALTPCAPNQTRNPDTNRCRSTAVAGASTLKPCQAGYTRNPQTNRCRKDMSTPQLANIQDAPSRAQGSNLHWLLAAGAVLAALGYGVYEWRQEVAETSRQLKAKLAKWFRFIK